MDIIKQQKTQFVYPKLTANVVGVEYTVFLWYLDEAPAMRQVCCRLRCAVSKKACLALGHHSCPVSSNLTNHSK